MFKVKDIKLGDISPGAVFNLKFPYDKIKRIISMESSCGCSIPDNNNSAKEIEVTYTAGKIPHHLTKIGVNTAVINKYIKVVYENMDGTSESVKLTISGHIKG